MACPIDNNIDKNYLKLAQIKHRLSSPDVSVNEIRLFLKTGFNINYALPSTKQVQHPAEKYIGYTALHFAVLVCKVKDRNQILKLLISQGADITCQGRDSFTPLRLAFEIYKATKLTGDNKTLYQILLSAHLKNYVFKNPRCNNGISHMHIACLMNNYNLIEFFLKAGLSVNQIINYDSHLYPGYSLLHLAIGNEDKRTVQLLLFHGADKNCLNARGLSPLHLIIEKQINDINVMERSCEKKMLNNEYVMNLFLEPSENYANVSDSIGLSLFHAYCTKKYSFKSEEWEIILNSGVNVNTPVNFNSPICSGFTPLHFAAHCSLQTMLLLVEKEANIFAKNANGMTPFDLCLEKHKPSDISRVFENHNVLKSIHFQNGDFLYEVLPHFDSTKKLEEYIKTTFINNTIPLDSVLWPGFTLLHLAVILSPGSDRSKVTLCLNQGADITLQDANNMTALHLAFRMKRRRCVIDILAHHANVSANPVDNQNLSHFHISCTVNSMKIPKMFLTSGQNPNTPSPVDESLKYISSLSKMNETTIPAGSTPLHIAVISSSKGFIKLLFDHNADPCILDSEGFTWVFRAFLNEKFDKFKFMLWSPFTEPTHNFVAPGGLTYLHVACYAGDSRAVQILLSLKCNINEPINNDILKYVNLPKSISLGDTPLHLAVKASSEQIVNLLLHHGANVMVKNSEGLNPLHIALLKSSSLSLMKRLAVEFDKRSWIDETGLTRLHVACALNDDSLIKKLLDLNEDIHARIKLGSPIWEGFTPLNVLLRQEYPQENQGVKLLLEEYLKKLEYSIQIEPNENGSVKRQKLCYSLHTNSFIVNQEGLTAFHVSCMGSDISTVHKFLQCGADVNSSKDYFASQDPGYAALHFAVKYGRKDVVKLLLSYGADFNLENSYGYNAIFLSVLQNLSCIEIFIRECRLNLSIKNSFGQTVIDLFLLNKNATSNHLLNLLKFGAAKNVDFSTRLRLVKTLFRHLTGPALKNLIENIPKLSTTDNISRNIIHHLAMPNDHELLNLKSSDFIYGIELLLSSGCDLDHQDKHGRTPLHYAVISSHSQKINTLLTIGADINLADIHGETPYTYCFKSNTHVPEQVYGLFHHYVDKLKAAGLYLHPSNEECHKKNRPLTLGFNYSVMLEKMNIKISEDITVRYLLTEKMVVDFYQMNFEKRQIILKCLDYDILHREFPAWSPILKLQRRKAVQKLKLVIPATRALQYMINSKLTEHCCNSILVHLNNEDWTSLIRAQRLK